MPDQATIAVDRLRVVRGGRPVLHEIALDVPGGRITGLLGPSGCGKSTLMRAIVGVQQVESGKVTVLGTAAGSPGLRARVGYVTQAPSVYQDLTVEANLRYFAGVLGADRAEVARVVETVSLGDYAGSRVDQLSGGQRARVSLATALLNSPEVLVLDEPTVGLDPLLRRELWATFRSLADSGVTLLVSSHVMDEADRCDRIVLMRDGRVLADEGREKLLGRTGCADVEQAFLAIVEREAAGVTPRITLATARRVLEQLRGDRRTIALLIVVPCVLIVLMKYVLEGDPETFQRIGVPMLGIFPLISMFLVTSIAMLRERTTGTLERLMTMPLAKLDLLLGYALAFAFMAALQVAAVSVVAFAFLDLNVAGPTWLVAVLAVANALLGMALGLFLSAFAATEFQAVQFLPAFLLPQLLLCGLIVPRDVMAQPLQYLAAVLPMTYAYDALERVATMTTVDARTVADALVVVGCTLLALCLGAATLRRRTA